MTTVEYVVLGAYLAALVSACAVLATGRPRMAYRLLFRLTAPTRTILNAMAAPLDRFICVPISQRVDRRRAAQYRELANLMRPHTDLDGSRRRLEKAAAID